MISSLHVFIYILENQLDYMKTNFSLDGTIVDLTHDYSNETIYWPTEQGFELKEEFDGITEKGYYYSAKKFSAPEHGGTHMDAPIHFAKNGKTIDQILLSDLIGNCAVIDVSEKSLGDSDYQISVSDIENWESSFGTLPDSCIVLFYTGYCKHWPDRSKYLGTSKIGKEALSELHFPGLHPKACEWLVENRKIKAIGLDTQSIDYGKSSEFETHQILCSKNIPFFENVANLDKLPAINSLVIALPMKIKDGSGAPLRIIAIIP